MTQLTDEEHQKLAQICQFYCKSYEAVAKKLPVALPQDRRDTLEFAKSFIDRCPVVVNEIDAISIDRASIWPCLSCKGRGYHRVKKFDPNIGYMTEGKPKVCSVCNGNRIDPRAPVLKAINEETNLSLAYLGDKVLDFDDCSGELAFPIEAEWFRSKGYALYPSDSPKSFCLVHGNDVWEINFEGDGNKVVETIKAILTRSHPTTNNHEQKI